MTDQRLLPDSGKWETYEWKIYNKKIHPDHDVVICEFWDNNDHEYKYTAEYIKERLSRFDYLYPDLTFGIENDTFYMKLDRHDTTGMKIVLEMFINTLFAPRLDCYNTLYDDLYDLKYCKEIVEEIIIRTGREKMLLDNSFHAVENIPVINNDKHMVVIDPRLVNLKLSAAYHRIAMYEDEDEMCPYLVEYFDCDEDVDFVYNYLKYRIDYVINNM